MNDCELTQHQRRETFDINMSINGHQSADFSFKPLDLGFRILRKQFYTTEHQRIKIFFIMYRRLEISFKIAAE